MSLFIVDSEKCKNKKDHICMDECPVRIIVMEDKDAVPRPVHDAGDLCIRCGHCVAVCAYGAITHVAMGPDQCPPVRWHVIYGGKEVRKLAAPSFGLGTCWAGYFNTAATVWPPMQEALELSEGHAGFGAMMIGHPRYAYHCLPLRDEPEISRR